MTPRITPLFQSYVNNPIMFALLVAIITLAGCSLDSLTDTSGSGDITIYNYDPDYGYRVRLYTVVDDTLIASQYVETYQTSGDTDSFDDVEPDYYYLTVAKEDATKISGQSGTFHLDEGESLCYMIEEDSDVKSCE